MNGDAENPSDQQTNDNGTDDVLSEKAPAVDKNVDNVGDMSVEINVEELVARIESSDSDTTDKEREIREKLEKFQAEQQEDLDSTYNFNLDDEL